MTEEKNKRNEKADEFPKTDEEQIENTEPEISSGIVNIFHLRHYIFYPI